MPEDTGGAHAMPVQRIPSPAGLMRQRSHLRPVSAVFSSVFIFLRVVDCLYGRPVVCSIFRFLRPQCFPNCIQDLFLELMMNLTEIYLQSVQYHVPSPVSN